ncbi:MAG: hypothetical protein IJP71_03400 [Lachnospiraceae bacterium]|nr:hypothetical protein [Lachnospiraceae bacterium]
MVKKIILSLLLVISLLSSNILAAVVSDNDGSAFITKAEFDSLKNSFQTELDSYNSHIDDKIDYAISSYLAGISVTPGGDFDKCEIEDYDKIQWRDKLIYPNVTVRKFTSRTAYTDTTGQNYEATYDTILQADTALAMADINAKISTIWSIFQPNGHGGWEIILKGSLSKKATDGNIYWVCITDRGTNRFWQPNQPLLYYYQDDFNETGDKAYDNRLKGSIEWGSSFTGISSHETDDSVAPDGTQYMGNNGYGHNKNTLKAQKELRLGTPGRDENAFGLEVYNTSGGRTGGIRPKKNATEYFPRWYDTHRNSAMTTCDYISTFPQSYPLTSDSTDESNDYICKMMCGSENTQEVNYITNRAFTSFWTTNFVWPDDCYKDYTLDGIYARKMMIFATPSQEWRNTMSEATGALPDAIFNTSDAGIFKFNTLPSSMTISMPTKPHKKLKLLNTNFFSKDKERKTRLRFGDGLPVVRENYKKCVVTMEFDVAANDGYSTTTYTPYMELRDTDFNTNGKSIDIKDGTKIPSKDHCYKIAIGHNKIQFELRADQKNTWARFSPGDNSGVNHLKISNLTAKYKVE